MKKKAIGYLIIEHNKKIIFDSYGYAFPPQEIIGHIGSENLFYNADRIQNYNDQPICRNLCLIVLEKLSKG
jgi:hypothetical protein